jgi:hypothetical protein
MTACLIALKSGGGTAPQPTSSSHEESQPSEAPALKYATTLENMRTVSSMPEIGMGELQKLAVKIENKVQEKK